MTQRAVRGSVAYHSGQSAELSVAAEYECRGYSIAERRWRGSGGEIDLIAHSADGLVFVEVKKSTSFDAAAARISRRQMDRICLSAQHYIGQQPDGQLTNMRFDAALVNAAGEVHIIENAFGLA